MHPQSVFDAFAASAARTPGADFLYTETVTAQVYGIAAGAISWQQAAAAVQTLRQAYAAAGYGHGHRVGLLLENRPDFFYHWFALNALGVSVVPINIEMRAAELQYLIGHSEICLAVTLPQRHADLQAAAQAIGHRLALLEWQADSPAPLDAAVPPAPTPAPHAGRTVDAQTECALLYTSGTTGRPKGCMLDNAYFLRAGRWYADLGGISPVRPDQERVMTPLPLTHMNAMACSAMVVLTVGGCLVQLDRFHPKTWLQSARESGATIVHYLGVMPAMLLAAPEEEGDRQHQIRWGFGAGVDNRNHAVFEARFGFPLVEAWAMTETGAAACIMANHEPRQVGTHCFGRPELFVQVRLVGEDGADVPDDTPGELWVRSAGDDPRRYFFRGYLKDEKATEEAWEGGWFHTGDMVRRDAQGQLHFVDRKKNVIRRSGENISAVEVESVLNQHPAVKTSAVAAAPDAVRGDEVLACIVLHAPAPADAQARQALAHSIVAHALAQLAYYKAPGYVAFVEALPLTPSQKIQRGQLRALAQQLLGQAHCIDTRSLKKRQD
ncbi:ATP-dependent acyl-CoA ligase [Allofranklinella schreckenbergeri]|uniref:ATP-dependent acyl-CoA ligase n=1 Tax=Allofranklinella schreckenbergeri TaxID=1076744 RepID=A0A3M6Q0I8_9BURK|nr:AMP-binding protein [Allofranklinella schreckenbergeri]RMW96793.1 ATP-dependent acyl-CoA ligase [Allofranklinella schreckenbergeri]